MQSDRAHCHLKVCVLRADSYVRRCDEVDPAADAGVVDGRDDGLPALDLHKIVRVKLKKREKMLIAIRNCRSPTIV